MLKGIDPLLTPDLVCVIASMGHGDDLERFAFYEAAKAGDHRPYGCFLLRCGVVRP